MKRPPKKASRGTWPVGSGARDVSQVATCPARSRSMPLVLGAPAPKIRAPRAAQRRSDDHCDGADRPRAVAALTARRTCSAVLCA